MTSQNELKSVLKNLANNIENRLEFIPLKTVSKDKNSLNSSANTSQYHSLKASKTVQRK
jgi:hypothetical protein